MAKNETKVTLSAGGKSVTMTGDQLEKLAEGQGPRNTQKLVEGFIKELTAVEDEIERTMEPLKQRRKDILTAAKDNQIIPASLKMAVKFKRAEGKKRKALQAELQATEVYLSFVQLTLFPGDSE